MSATARFFAIATSDPDLSIIDVKDRFALKCRDDGQIKLASLPTSLAVEL